MSKLNKITRTLYHSYNGADGELLPVAEADTAIKALFLELIDQSTKHPFLLLGYWYDCLSVDELRKAVSEL